VSGTESVNEKATMPYQFKRLMIARALFSFASQMQSVVLGWQMYQLTKSPLYIGLIGLAEAIPAIGLALHAGAIVDRGVPELIYKGLLKLCFLSVVVMVVSQIEGFGIPGFEVFGLSGGVWGLFAAYFTAGIGRAFAQPSMYALIPKVVSRELLATASAWAAMWLQLARVSGPALGGVLMAVVGIYGTSLAIGTALLGALFWSISPGSKEDSLPKQSVGLSRREELLSGLKFVVNHPILFPALSIDMVCVLFGGVTALLPVFAEEVLHVGPEGLGLLRAAPSLGAALMGYALTSFNLKRYAGRYFLTAVAGFGVSILVFSLSDSFIISLAALFFSGAFDSISVVVRSAAVQLSSPDDMRGRISAVNSIFIGSSNEIGEVESGVLAHYIGTVPTAVVGGIACLAILSVAAVGFPKLRALNLHELERARA
jgi:MFS family permease